MRVNAHRSLDLVVQLDIARRLGVTRQRVNQLAADDAFPAPLGKLGRSLVWDWAEVERWADATGRTVVAAETRG